MRNRRHWALARQALAACLCCQLWCAAAPAARAVVCEPPAAADKAVLDAKLARLKSHLGSLPAGGAITDVLGALTAPLHFSVPCKPGSAVDQLQITVTVTFSAWKPAVTGPGETGNYYSDAPTITVEGRTKIIGFSNCVMLDPAIAAHQETTPPIGPMADEALLYHELLHGQLAINTMKLDVAWQDSVCSCKTPGFQSVDADHAVIEPLQDQFLRNLVGPDQTVSISKAAGHPAGPDGTFHIDLGTVDKPSWTADFALPDRSNISTAPGDTVLRVTEDDQGHLILSGRLSDPTKPGYVFVMIDPPSTYIVCGIEQGFEIPPFATLAAPPLAGVEPSFRVRSVDLQAAEVRFEFGLAAPADVDIGVYDLSGRRVTTVVKGAFGAGTHAAIWSLRATGGAPAPGVYFARMRTRGREFLQRVVILR